MKIIRNIRNKRKIALYLAVIMLFNLFMPFAEPMRLLVQAQAPIIQVMPGGMAVGTDSSSPFVTSLENATTRTNHNNYHVYMTFPLEDFGEYVLTYPLQDGNVVEVRIRVVAGVATVTYIRPGPVGQADPGFQVHLAPLESRFIPIPQYITHPHRPNAPGNRVMAFHPDDPRVTAVSPPGLALEPDGSYIWPPDPDIWPPSEVVPPPNWPMGEMWPPFGWDLWVFEGTAINNVRPQGFPTGLPWPPANWPPTGWNLANFDPDDSATFPPQPPGWPAPIGEWPPEGWDLWTPTTVINPVLPPGWNFITPPGPPTGPPWPPVGWNPMDPETPYPPGWPGGLANWPPQIPGTDPPVYYQLFVPGYTVNLMPPPGWPIWPPPAPVWPPAGWPPAGVIPGQTPIELLPQPPFWPAPVLIWPGPDFDGVWSDIFPHWPLLVPGDRDPIHYRPVFPPTFEISNGHGFSFIYRGEIIHMRFDTDNTFHFAADHFAPGFIYDVVLSHLDSNTQSGVFVNSGFTGLNFTPFANAYPGGRTTNVFDRFAERWDYINRRQGHTHTFLPPFGVSRAPGPYEGPPEGGRPGTASAHLTDTGRWPAMPEEPLGFYLSFNRPIFLPLPGSGRTIQGNLGGLQGFIDFQPVDPFGFTITVGNVGYGVPNIVTHTPRVQVRDIRTTGAALNVIELEVLTPDPAILSGDLFRPSIIYSPNSYVTLLERNFTDGTMVGGQRWLAPRVTTIGVEQAGIRVPAFTLLNYEITIINGMYHVVITTPYGQDGEYVILEAPHPGIPGIGIPPGDITLSMTGVVRAGQPIAPIPLRGDAFAGQRFVQVYFKPGETPFSDSELNLVRAGTWPMRSQGIWWAGDEDDIDLRTTEFFNVELIDHAPREGDLERRTGVAELELTWSIGQTDFLERFFNIHAVNGVLEIDYRFNWSFNPYDTSPDHFVDMRVRMTTPPALGLPHVVEYTLLNYGGTPVTAGGTPVGNILQGIELLPPPLNDAVSPPAPTLLHSPLYGLMAQVRIEVNTYHYMLMRMNVPQPVTPPRGLNFPRIYFMNVQPIRVWGGTGFQTPSSQYSSFTLSEFEDYRVPPPQNLQVVPGSETSLTRLLDDPRDQVSFAVTWDVPLAQIQNYLERSFGLLHGPRNEFDFEMTLYISQSENQMVNQLPNTNNIVENPVPPYGRSADRHEARMGLGVTTVFDAGGLESGPVTAVRNNPSMRHSGSMYFSYIDGNPVNITGSGEPRDVLRDGGIVAIRNLRLPDEVWGPVATGGAVVPLHTVVYTLDGLDKNQQYYVYVDFVVTQWPNRNFGGIDFEIAPGEYQNISRIVESSFLSNMIGVTVPDDRDVPDGLDRDPMAPDLAVLESSITLNSAILYWDRVPRLPLSEHIEGQGYSVAYEYELIRIRDNQMSNDPDELLQMLNNRAAFPEVWASLSEHEDIIAFETTAAATPGAIALRGLNGRPGQPNMALIVPQQTDPPGLDPIMVLDQTMRANNVYFFYARTVRTVTGPSGVTTTFSVWSHVSVTTTIAGAPRNLRIAQMPLDFDRENEVLIEFEAPILYTSLSELIGAGRVILEYEIQVDDEGWNRRGTMGNAYLMANARVGSDEPPGWTWFLYHLRGIEPGRMHHVRVRLVEMEGGVRISESMWSNVATWLADGGDEDDRFNQEERDWLDYLRRRLEELLRNPYWVIRDDPNAFQIIYRIGMFNNIVATAVGGRIHLPFENSRQTTYYIPFEAFKMAWDAEQSFVLTNTDGNMRLMVPARSIDLFDNDVVIDVNRVITQRQFADYMVRFNVNWSEPEYIQGEETLTPVADVRFDLVTVTQIIRDRQSTSCWEQQLERALIARVDELIDDPDTIEFIRDAVRDERVTSEDISREMVRIVEIAARQALGRVVSDNFRDLTARSRNWQVDRLDRSMSVSAITGPNLSAVEAYQSTGGNLWNNIPTVDVGDGGLGIFTAQPGFFAFTGRTITIQGIEQVQGGPVATGVVARHGLDDFFGRGNFDVNQVATRSQLINSVARMTGAPRGADAVPWLRQNGVNVMAAGMNNPITYQSALDLVMMVYEAQTGTQADSLRITNFTFVNNLPGIGDQYRTSVAAAIELGLVDANNLQPTAHLTVGSLLEMLAVLDRLVGL